MFGRLRLTTLLLLLISFLNFAVAAPLPRGKDDADTSNVNKRASEAEPGPTITLQEYKDYLNKYYPLTNQYILYSGGSADQVHAFQAENPGYYYYEDFFNAYKSEHYFTAFAEDEWRMDDGDASSQAIAETAREKIWVFGAAEYKSYPGTFYTSKEAPAILDAVKNGDLSNINHMAKDATSTSDILATEDGDGKFTYQGSYQEGTPNASGVPDAPDDPLTDSESDEKCKQTSGATCGLPYGDTAQTSGSSTASTDTANTEGHIPGSTSEDTTPHDTTTGNHISDPAHIDKPGGGIHI